MFRLVIGSIAFVVPLVRGRRFRRVLLVLLRRRLFFLRLRHKMVVLARLQRVGARLLILLINGSRTPHTALLLFWTRWYVLFLLLILIISGFSRLCGLSRPALLVLLFTPRVVTIEIGRVAHRLLLLLVFLRWYLMLRLSHLIKRITFVGIIRRRRRRPR